MCIINRIKAFLIITVSIVAVVSSSCQRTFVDKSEKYGHTLIYLPQNIEIKDNRYLGPIKDYINQIENRPEIEKLLKSKNNIFYQMVIDRKSLNKVVINISCIEASSYAFNKFPPSGFMILNKRVVLIYTGLELFDKDKSELLLRQIKDYMPDYISDEPKELIIHDLLPTREFGIVGDGIYVKLTDIYNNIFCPDSIEKIEYTPPIIVDTIQATYQNH